MIHPRALLVFLLSLTAMPAMPATADDGITVIVGKAPPNIAFDHATLEDIFLKRIHVDNDRVPLTPINLAATDPVRESLSLDLFGRRPEGMQRYWTERYFHGITPPYTVRSQEAMLRFVMETPGSVGYVAACRVDARVHAVATLPVPAGLAQQVRRQCEKDATGGD